MEPFLSAMNEMVDQGAWRMLNRKLIYEYLRGQEGILCSFQKPLYQMNTRIFLFFWFLKILRISVEIHSCSSRVNGLVPEMFLCPFFHFHRQQGIKLITYILLIKSYEPFCDFLLLCDIYGEYYRSGTVNQNTVNSKYHLILSFFEMFARFLSFHV